MVIPKDLYEFVKSRGCGQVTDFYKRIAIERPPYAYDNSSYVVWCTKDLGTQDPQREYTLLIYVKAPPFSKCPEKIEKWHPIGGLEFVEVSEPAEWYYFVDSKKQIPVKGTLSTKAIRSEYGGVGEYFVCVNGKWAFRSFD